MSANHLNSQKTSTNRHQEKLLTDFDTNTMHYHLSKLFKEYSILPQKLWQHWPLVLVKHVIKTYFWALVYLVLSFLTITSTYEVYQQYRDNPVTTNMKAVINNNITYLPNMTICLKINASELFSISSSSSFNYMSAWSRFFEETISEGIFKVNESQIYDDEIYLSLLKYLAMIYESERAWESGLTMISTFQLEESEDWMALKNVLVPNIERFHITLEQLKSVFDGKFCSLPKTFSYSNYLLALGYGASGEMECIAGSKISFIGMDTICFRFIGYKNYLQQLGTTDPIYLHLYDDHKNREWCQEITIDLGSESRSTPRRATIPYETSGSYYNRFPGQVAIHMDIGVKALYQKLPYVKGGVQCSSDTSREECENKCLREWIKESCRCSPTTFNLTNPSHYRSCTVDDYSICLKDYAEHAAYFCTYKCVPLCEQWHYEYNLESSGYTFSSGFVQINTKTFDFVIIEQVFSCQWSFEEFIGMLGATLAFWIGLNVLVIIEFLINLSKKFIKKILMGTFHSSKDDNHRTSADIEHRERSVENGISWSNTIGSRAAWHQNEYEENESEIAGTSHHQVNESEKQRESRKKKENSSLKKFLQLTENLFWATLYLIGSVFTTLWCIKLINLYLADASVYYPSLIIGRTASLPPPSLCIQYENRLFFERRDNISAAFMDYFGQSDMDRASLLQISDGRTWPQQLFSIGLVYFSILAAAEVNHYDVSFKSKYERQLYFIAGDDSLLRNDIDKSLSDILLPKLLEWNVTANELRQKLGAELARMAELKISYTNSYGTADFVKDGSFYTAAITEQFFCYGLTYAVSFTASDETLEVSINRASHPQLFWGRESFIYFSDYLLEPKSTQFGIRDSLDVYGSSSFPLEYGTVTNTLISVDGLYTSRPEVEGEQFCSPNMTKSYCRAQCRIELIEKLCDCSPTYWTKMIQPTSDLDECTFDRYMGCLNFNYDDDLDCKDSCLPFCVTKYFQSDSNNEYQENFGIAIARFGVKDSFYLSIEEEKSLFVFIDLLIKLRGTLGILLGFNIFSFYQALITTTTLCFAFILKKTRLAQSSSVLKSADKIKKSGIGQLISKLNQHLIVIKSCAIMNKIKMHKTGRNILLAIGYMFGLYVAVRMCNNLYHSYRGDEQPKCIIDLMINDTIKLPSSTICIPLEAVEFLPKTEISLIENNIHLTSNLYINSFNDKEEFFSALWPSWLMKWMYEYLIIYEKVERHGNQKLISTLLADDGSCASDESSNTTSTYSFTSLMKLDELIDYFNITIFELKQNLGQKVRDIYYNTTAVFMQEVDGAWEQTALYITETTFIGEGKICYKLPLNTVTFSSKSDYVSILLDRGLLPNPQYSRSGKLITIDFTVQDVSKEESNSLSLVGSTLSFVFGASSFAKLDISRIYEAKPKSYGVQQCSKSKSMDTCLDECQLNKIERVCKCSPVTRKNFLLNTNLTQCHLIDYKRCTKFLGNGDADLCELSCVPHCTRINFKGRTSWNGQLVEYSVAMINLTVNSFEYLNIKEEYTEYTKPDFMSEFGGIFGLLIGLDVLTVVDLFYWLYCQYCHTLMTLILR